MPTLASVFVIRATRLMRCLLWRPKMPIANQIEDCEQGKSFGLTLFLSCNVSETPPAAARLR